MWINITPEELKLIRHCLGHETGEDVTELVDKLETWETRARSPLYKQFRDTAVELHHRDGKCEVDEEGDDTCSVSLGEDLGAYVMAWVWVSDSDARICRVCGDHPGTETYGTVGDSYDDMCPSCCDKAEAEEEEEEMKAFGASLLAPPCKEK